MPKGYCTIQFVGGSLDGHSIEVPSMHLSASIQNDSETSFVQEANGKVAIYKGKRTPSIPWFSFAREIYQKMEQRLDGVIMFSLQQKQIIERCSATTQKGMQCGHEAIYGKSFCKRHSNTGPTTKL